MFNLLQLRLITFAVSLASILYEYCLSHVMAILYGGVISHYILTIGFFIFFLGIGALFFDKCLKGKSQFKLYRLELLLSLLGYIIVISPFFFDSTLPAISRYLSWSLICLIAFLSGIELPALLHISKNKLNTLAFDYLGMCLGGVLFTLFFLPQIGILNTSFIIATINLLIAHLLIHREESRYRYFFLLFYIVPITLFINNDVIQLYIEGVFVGA